MFGAPLLLATLAAATPTPTTVGAPAPAVAPVREERPFAIWLEPQLTAFSFGSGRADILGSDVGALPLGIELGGQIRRVFLSLAIARLPIEHIERDEVMLAGRFYLGEWVWAPYLAAAVGWMTEEVEETGGQHDSHLFAAAGIGQELALRNGISVTADLLVGPDFLKDRFSSSYDDVNLSGWLRVGIGYRF
jgi:hypothetical protein